MKNPIKYEPHPVSPERKAELRKAGFIIVDARFKPIDAKDDEPMKPTEGLTRTQVARMTKGALVDELQARGLDVGGTADEMRERLANEVF